MAGSPPPVLLRLGLDPSECVPLGLRLNDASCPVIHIELVVGSAVARPQRELPHRQPTGGTNVQGSHVLHRPTC